MLGAVAEKVSSLAAPATPTTTAAPAPTGIEGQLQQLATTVQALVTKDDGKAKAERRAAITTAVAGTVAEQHRELIRGALATLALDGEIDLHAEATQAEVDKALTKLRAKHPAAFATAGNSSPADSVRHGVIPEGTPLHELTREQLAAMPDEEFSKRRREGAKSRLAV